MSQWVFTSQGFTPVAVADAANFTNLGYMGLMGGSATQRLHVSEIYLGGLAGASAPTPMVFSRDSIVQVTPSALSTAESNAALDPSTAALAAPQVAFTQSTTKPQRSSTLAKLALGFNAFGGNVHWMAPPGGEFRILGNTASLGEASLSCFTGGVPGLLDASIVYEPL